MSSYKIDKVNKLIALTASSNVDEARNAALAACTLIREHNLQIVERKVSTPIPASALRDPMNAAWEPVSGSMWDGRVDSSQVDARGNIRRDPMGRARPAAAKSAAKRPEAEPRQGRTGGERSETYPAAKKSTRVSDDDYPRRGFDEMDPQVRQIQSKHPGSCKACGTLYEEGETVLWLKGHGCICVDNPSCRIPPFGTYG